MEERLQLALLDNENSTQFRWLKYISKQYRRQHVTVTQLQDITDAILLQILALTHANGHLIANTAKLRVLEDIITDTVTGGSVHALEVFEMSEVPFEYRHMLLKRTKEVGGHVTYYRWVLRTLITEYHFAREVLRLDRDEELEASHHLSQVRNESPQVIYELGLWYSLQEKYSDAAFYFNELGKKIESDYKPLGDLAKVTTLTYEKLKGYLGIYPKEMEIAKDESYARELFHYCEALDKKKLIHREKSDNCGLKSVDPCLITENISDISSHLKSVPMQTAYSNGRLYTQASLLESRHYTHSARDVLEDVLSRLTNTDLPLFSGTLFSCCLLTPLEQDLSQSYFESVFEVVEKYWSPDPRMWAQMLGLIVDSKLAREFITKVYTLPIPDAVKDITKVVEDFIVLNEALEPLSLDLCEAYYLPLIDGISRLELPLLSLFARSLQRKQTALKLARLLFTLARMLKYPDHAQDYEHFCSFNELVSFGEDSVMDVPSTIYYKLRTGKYEFRRILEGTEISAAQYLRLAGSPAAHSFMGNVYLLEDNYRSAISEYLSAIKTSPDSPMLVKRLCVCLWKCGAEFEALLLAHLCDKDFTVAKVWSKLTVISVDPALARLMCEAEFIEAVWEVCKGRPDIRKKLLALLETPERHQNVRDNALLKKQVAAQFFDLLRVALRFAKGVK